MTTYTVPALDADTADLIEDLTGIDPDLDTAVAALARLAVKRLDLDTVPTLLAALAGGTHGNPDLLRLLAHLVQRIGDPSTNPALRDLTPHRAQQVRKHTRQYTAYDTDFTPRGLCSEAAGYADPDCPLPTHHP